MRKVITVAVAIALVGAAMPAMAELQSVQVGGEVCIRGNYVRNTVVTPPPLELRMPASLLPRRAIGDMASFVGSGFNPAAVRNGGAGILSPVIWDEDNGSTWHFVEQRTLLNVTATFTDDVCAFIELDSYDIWGEDFRSNYITGADSRAVSTDDVEVFQAYINVDNFLLDNLSLRLGRQELKFGNQWLVGNNDVGPLFRGHSFDGIRLTYGADAYSVDAWWAKLAENSPGEEDGDVDFYGIYATCRAVEGCTFDVYGLWVRDGRSLNDTNFIAPLEWVEDLIGLDDYDVTNIYTTGVRAAGKMGPVDFNVEAAYQWGDADQVGVVFKPFLYGDDDAQYDAWAGTLEIGYTIDMIAHPRIFARADYFGGEDNRDLSFAEWLNPFDEPNASVSFNRLFSNKMHSGFFDLNKDMSNMWLGTVGVNVFPTESLMVALSTTYFEALDTFDRPYAIDVGHWRVPVAPALSWWTDSSDPEIGWETDLVFVYNYSEDLSFLLHWSHLFPGDGLEEGSFTYWNGLLSNAGTDKDESDYVTFETRLRF
ncbi:MAG: alginate export family protein [bacterium]|nr:alginate export family protein [bacterium]